MKLPALIGNERLKQALATGASSSLSGGTLMLEGPAGSGKRTAARAVAKSLLCENRSAAPCGVCGACIRFDAGSHPDFELFNEAGGDIKVDDVRELRARSFLRPSEAECKMIVINGADKMNVQSQNALLKVLEEPRTALFILLTQSREMLLPTVRSRCTIYALAPLDDAALLDELRLRAPDRTEDELHQACHASDGFLGAALASLSGESGACDELATRFCVALSRDELSVLEVCMEIGKLPREQFGLFCDAACVALSRQILHGGTPIGALLRIYEYLEAQKKKMQQNASVSAISGALAAFCANELYFGG